MLDLHVVLRETLSHSFLEHHVFLNARGEARALRVGQRLAVKRVDALAVTRAHDLVIPAIVAVLMCQTKARSVVSRSENGVRTFSSCRAPACNVGKRACSGTASG